MKIAAAYIRVSTADQTEYSPDAQLKAIREYAKRNNIEIDNKFIFRDEGISGRLAENRPGFMEMIRIAKSTKKPFDLILVHKFSRFARSREDSIVYKTMLRKKCGIDIVSVTEPVTDDKFSIVIEAMHEAMDEYYSINLSGEVKKGMKEKAQRGEIQTAPPFGYTKEAGKPLATVEEEAKYVRLIYEWYLEGESCYSIAYRLNALGVRTKRNNPFESRSIEYILNNPTYKGYARWSPEKIVSKRIFDSPHTIIIKSSHEPIISEYIFAKAESKIKKAKADKGKKRPSVTKKHYLSGILKCGSCGSALAYSNANNGFQCIKYARGSCKRSHFIQKNKAEKALLNALSEVTSSRIYFRKPDAARAKKDLIKTDIEHLRHTLYNSKNAYLHGVDTLKEYADSKESLKKKIALKERELQRIQSEIEVIQKRTYTVSDVLSEDSSAAQKNAALSGIVEKAVFSRPEKTLKIYIKI
jgi:site-specific DNA recombinase